MHQQHNQHVVNFVEYKNPMLHNQLKTISLNSPSTSASTTSKQREIQRILPAFSISTQLLKKSIIALFTFIKNNFSYNHYQTIHNKYLNILSVISNNKRSVSSHNKKSTSISYNNSNTKLNTNLSINHKLYSYITKHSINNSTYKIIPYNTQVPTAKNSRCNSYNSSINPNNNNNNHTTTKSNSASLNTSTNNSNINTNTTINTNYKNQQQQQQQHSLYSLTKKLYKQIPLMYNNNTNSITNSYEKLINATTSSKLTRQNSKSSSNTSKVLLGNKKVFNKINKDVHLAINKSLLHNASYNYVKTNKGRNSSKNKGESAKKGTSLRSAGNCCCRKEEDDERYDGVDTAMFVKMTDKDEKVKGIEQLKEIKLNLDDNLKVMFNFSYEGFLNKESESESRRSFDEGNVVTNSNSNRMRDNCLWY